MILQTSWLCTDGAHAALFDELSKISEDQTKKPGWKGVARTIGTGVLGAAAGLGAVQAGIGFVPPIRRFLTQGGPNKKRMANVILPILGGAALMLADRYRKRMDEGMFGKPEPHNQKK